jgi:pyrroline-5-carboxylate reductase
MKRNKIALIGCGVMGSIIFEILCKMKSFEKLVVIDPNLINIKKIPKRLPKNIVFSSNINDSSLCDVYIIAVKPQDFRGISINSKKDSLIISIMAGISVNELTKVLKVKKVVRAMPNMLAKIKKGVVGYYVNGTVSTEEKIFANNLFSEMGTTFSFTSENEIDMITSVSGSGPAYVYYMIDCFINAACSVGLKENEARKIVLETVKGSLALVDEKTNFSELIKSIASKGGTTESAIRVFEDSKMDKIWAGAIKKAYNRARELSSLK